MDFFICSADVCRERRYERDEVGRHWDVYILHMRYTYIIYRSAWADVYNVYMRVCVTSASSFILFHSYGWFCYLCYSANVKSEHMSIALFVCVMVCVRLYMGMHGQYARQTVCPIGKTLFKSMTDGNVRCNYFKKFSHKKKKTLQIPTQIFVNNTSS